MEINEIPEERRMKEGKKLIDGVREMSLDFVGEGMPVKIQEDSISKLAEIMTSEGKTPFNVESTNDMNHASAILVDLMASAINYCFWYGKYNFVPMKNNSSYSMYDVVINAVAENFRGLVDHEVINAIIDRLMFDRYPLIEERVKHLLEVSLGTQEFIMFTIMNKNNDVKLVLHELVRRYPGFSSDMFLKRAFLFVIQLNRKLGFFEDTINEIPVPADYQVPKMLEHFGCLKYIESLNNKINSHTIIPKGSIDEISIRSGTVLACDKLSEITGWKRSEVDAWLWLRRKECDKPFHLTITTDY
jgi:hypothetical protein